VTRYTLEPAADLAVMYAADTARYAAGSAVLENLTPEAFRRFYAGCPSRGFAFDGQAIGGMVFDGQEAHIAVLAEHHGRWARLLAPSLEWLFGLKAELCIEIEPDNHTTLAFMDRNGWARIAGRPGSAGVSFLVRRVRGRGREPVR
jgi:hypothetical protein